MKNLIDLPYNGLYKVISGGQTGADQAGIRAAYLQGVETGGYIPKGCRTVFGSDFTLKEQFNLIETSSKDYPPRTKKNASESDATVRFASNFNTAGEKLTLQYAQAAGKPIHSILLDGQDYDLKAQGLVDFIINHSVGILNVAGNADRDKPISKHHLDTMKIFTAALLILKQKNLLITYDPSRSTPSS